MQQQVESWPLSGSGERPDLLTSAAGPHAWLGRTPLIAGLIGGYLLLHFVLRLLLSPTLGIDDAEQVLFAQQWAWGYRFRQPPLFTWLLMPVIDWVGPGVLAVSIVRYVLLALTYGFLYLTALHWIEDRRLAALSVLSFASIYVFAYYAHHDLTHTTALGALIAASLFIFTKLSRHKGRRPAVPLYLLLGLCFGLGMLAKWNFVMLALGLPLTCLLVPGYRHLILTWKILPALAVMALIVSPTAFWMFSHGHSTGSVSTGILSGDENVSGLMTLLQGVLALLRSTALFPLPFVLIFLTLFGSALPGARSKRAAAERDGASVAQMAGPDPSFLGWLMLVILGLHLLLIPTFGAVTFTERWMHPALMVLPIFLFAMVAQRPPTGRSISFYLWVIAILVAVVVGARLYRYWEGADDCGKCREFAPFASLAQDLRAAGFEKGAIVADGMHVGGNLRMSFPESRMIDPAFPLALWPSPDDRPADREGACLLVWREGQPDSEARRQAIRQFAADELQAPAASIGKTGRVEAMLYRSTTRSYALGFELIQENAGGCR